MSASALIAVVLDRSGSMAGIATDTVGSFNTFLEKQKQITGDVRFTLVLFSHEYQLVHDGVPVQQVPALTQETYRPDGWTALNDAVGFTIDSVGKKLEALPEAERPSRVAFMILTDGQENKSKEYTLDRVREMIKHQQDRYAWEFIFLGADLNAVTVANSMGIATRGAMAYDASQKGINQLFASAASNVAQYASGGAATMDWSQEDRDKNAPTN